MDVSSLHSGHKRLCPSPRCQSLDPSDRDLESELERYVPGKDDLYLYKILLSL